MAIAKVKRRYMVTLTQSNVERFQSLCKDIGLPVRTMSNACDDIIRNLCDQFQIVKEQGQISVSQLLTLMGGQMDLLEEERKEKSQHEIHKNVDTQTAKSKKA